MAVSAKNVLPLKTLPVIEIREFGSQTGKKLETTSLKLDAFVRLFVFIQIFVWLKKRLPGQAAFLFHYHVKKQMYLFARFKSSTNKFAIEIHDILKADLFRTCQRACTRITAIPKARIFHHLHHGENALVFLDLSLRE
jgi:hypothetical protein